MSSPLQIHDPCTTSPVKDLHFHKNIDLGKSPSTMPETMNLNSTCNNSLNKVPSMSSISSAWRKTSFLSSLNSPSRLKHDRHRSNVPVPHVNISELIRKKAHLYHDESLGFNFDDVLESGYNLVLERKHERILLKDQEDKVRENLNKAEKETLPEMNRLFSNKEEIKYQRNTTAKYLKELEHANEENLKVEQAIEDQKIEVEQKAKVLVNKLKELDAMTHSFQNELTSNKESHKQELLELSNVINGNQARHKKLLEELNRYKNDYQKMRSTHIEQKRKMENKSKMFLGILKH